MSHSNNSSNANGARSYPVLCSTCVQHGHFDGDCKERVAGARAVPVDRILCYNCGYRGHFAVDCQERVAVRATRVRPNGDILYTCSICLQEGHMAGSCGNTATNAGQH